MEERTRDERVTLGDAGNAGATGRDGWAALAPGDVVESEDGVAFGEVLAAEPERALIRDGFEHRDLWLRRSACVARSGGGLRLRPGVARTVGEGPESYVWHEELFDDWTAQQSRPGFELTVEGEGPLRGRRATMEGAGVVPLDDEPSYADDEDPVAREMPAPYFAASHEDRRDDIRIGGAGRPSARALTPSITALPRAATRSNPSGGAPHAGQVLDGSVLVEATRFGPVSSEAWSEGTVEMRRTMDRRGLTRATERTLRYPERELLLRVLDGLGVVGWRRVAWLALYRLARALDEGRVA